MKRQAFVPLVTYPEPNSDPVAANAVAVAAMLEAGLHALALNAEIRASPSALSRFLLNVPEMIRETEAMSRKRGAHLLEAVAERAAAAGVEVTTGTVAAQPALLAETAAAQARHFDLAMLGWEAGNVASRMFAEALVFGAGRPVLLMPEQVAIGTFDHVALAWDGSRVAARAVADARPFLARAARVSVLSVLDEKPLKQATADRLAEALGRAGVKAEAVPLRGERRPIAATLQQGALEHGASLLVMGGYGHSRLRDFVLGGATAGVLNDLLLPVQISH